MYGDLGCLDWRLSLGLSSNETCSLLLSGQWERLSSSNCLFQPDILKTILNDLIDKCDHSWDWIKVVQLVKSLTQTRKVTFWIYQIVFDITWPVQIKLCFYISDIFFWINHTSLNLWTLISILCDQSLLDNWLEFQVHIIRWIHYKNVSV